MIVINDGLKKLKGGVQKSEMPVVVVVVVVAVVMMVIIIIIIIITVMTIQHWQSLCYC
jgi:hypothetical protein